MCLLCDRFAAGDCSQAEFLEELGEALQFGDIDQAHANEALDFALGMQSNESDPELDLAWEREHRYAR